MIEHIDGVNVHDLGHQFKLNPAEIATICHGVLSGGAICIIALAQHENHAPGRQTREYNGEH